MFVFLYIVVIIEYEVTLHADGGNGQSLADEWSEVSGYTFHLCRLIHREIVVVKLGGGVCLVGILECQGYVVFPQNLIEEALAKCSVILKSLIDHIPGFDSSFEMTDNSGDMLAHALLQDLRRNEVSLFVIMEPWGTL